MSNEGTGTKWLVGCLVAGVLMLLLCGGGLFMIGWFGYRTANQVAQSVSTGLEEQMQQMHFASTWQPPGPGSGADRLFPDSVNAWRLASHDDDSAIVELGIERDGLHALYESGVAGVDVYAYEVPAVEQSALFQEAADAIEAVNYTTRLQGHVDDGTSHRMTFSFSPPETNGRLWWCRGWLFVFKTDNSNIDLDAFQKQYLTAIAEPELDRPAPASETLEAVEPDEAPEAVTPEEDVAPDAVLEPGGESAPDAPQSPVDPR